MEVLDKCVQWDRQMFHLHLAHVGPREKEQLIHNARHPVDFFEIALQDDFVVVGFARASKREFGFPFHDRQRCAQFVRGIAAELADLPKGGFKPVDHVIKRLGQTTDFVGRGRNSQSLCEIASGNSLSSQRDRIDRAKGSACHEPAAGERYGQRDGHTDQKH